MAKQEKEIERWVTMNGVRVPIYKDGSIGGPKELRDKIKAKDKKVQKQVDSRFKSKEKSKEGKSSFDKARDHEVSNLQNAKENVDMLKEQLKKHPNDTYTAEIKARLKKAQAEYKKLQSGDTSDSNFKTAKEHDTEKKTSKKETPNQKAFKEATANRKAHREGKKPLPSSFDDMTSQEREEWRKKTEKAARKDGATSTMKGNEKNRAQKDIAKNEDIKEKQIAKNKAEKDKLNGNENTSVDKNQIKKNFGASAATAQKRIREYDSQDLREVAEECGFSSSQISKMSTQELKAAILAIYTRK
jgi:hypothetical protein